MKTAVVLLLSSLAYATAYICCPPTQWEGMFDEAGGYVVNRTGQTDVYTYGTVFHHDLSIQKVAFEGPDLKVVQNFATKIQYTVSSGVCTKMILRGSAEDSVCIPDHARYVNTLHYQSGDVITDNYAYQITQQGIKKDITINVERTTCIPFGIQGISYTPVTTTVYSAVYFNTTSSIKDPSVFDVPDVCQNVNSSIPIKESDAEATSHSSIDLARIDALVCGLALISFFDKTWW